MLNTMNYLVLLLGTVAIVNSAAILQNNHVISPVEKTSILGPSGSITQFKNFDSSLSRDLTSTPLQITGILGPSGSIKQEKYFHSTNDHTSTKTVASPSSEITYIVGPSDSSVVKSEFNSKKTDDCIHDNEEVHKQVTNHHHEAIANSQTVHHYGLYSVGKKDSTYGVNYVKELSGKTSVVGPSGSITQENYPSVLNKFLAEIYNFEKNHPVTDKTVLHSVNPVVGKYDVLQGNQFVISPSEKTSVVGPSGSITQEKTYYQSVSNEYPTTVYNVVKNNAVTGKPVVVQQVQPVFKNVAVSHVVNSPSEKTSVVGPSGSITQEKNYYQSASNEYPANVYTVVKNNPVTGKPVVVQHEQPAFENVAASHVVNSPSEKTSVVGPSGSITQEKYYQSVSDGNSAKVYNVVKTNPVTGKPVVVQQVQPVVENVAVTQGNHIVTSPSEKTSVVGSSGSITQEKYYQSVSNEDSAKVYNVVKINPVTGKPVVVQHVTPVVENVAVTQGNHIVTSPSEKTSVVGPSGSITQEKYYQSASNENSAKVYNVVKINPVTGKPVVVQQVQPAVENVAVTQGNHIVTSPSEKTSVVGPSGSITQEKYYQSVSNENSANVYNVVKTNTVTGKPVVVQHVQPVVEKVAVTQGNHIVTSPSEKTSVVGPSGSITQEKYYQSASNENSAKVYNVVKINPVTGKPVVVQHVTPVVENVAVTQGNHIVTSPSEKTSVVGPSGSITQEKYHQSVSYEDSAKVYNVVKINPVTGKPVVVQQVQPAVENVAVTQGNHIVTSPSEKTSVVGPSGSITQEKYYQSVSNENSANVYNVVKTNTVTGKPDIVQHVQPVVEKVAVTQGNHIVTSPSEKTSVVGPSGSITQEKYYQSVSNEYPTTTYNVVKNSPVSNQPTFVQYVQPEVGNVVVTQENQISNSPSEKTSIVGPSGSVTHEKYYQYVSNEQPAELYHVVKNNPVYVVQDVKPVVGNVAVAHVANSQNEKTSVVGPSGSITQEKYYQYLSNEDPTQIYKIVEQNPTNEHYIVAEPAVGNFVTFPSEKTSVVGPSGSITQEKYSHTNSISGAYKQVTSPVLVHYGIPPSKNVAFIYGNSINNGQLQPIVNVDAIKTTESHHSTSSSEETDCDEAGETDQEHSQHNKNSVANFYYTYPSTSNYAVVSGNHVNTPVSYNTVNSGYLVHYGTPYDENASVVYGSHGVDNSAVKTSIVGPSGSITQESNSKSGYVTKVGNAVSGTVGYIPYGFVRHVTGANVKSKVEYPEIQKYPDISAPDC